jgi:hypothetical protein
MAGRAVTLLGHSTHWLERIQIYHISLLQFTEIKKGLCVQSVSYRSIMKTARLDWSDKCRTCKTRVAAAKDNRQSEYPRSTWEDKTAHSLVKHRGFVTSI